MCILTRNLHWWPLPLPIYLLEKHCTQLRSWPEVCWQRKERQHHWPPFTEGKGRPQKEATHSRLVGDSFNKQGNLGDLTGCHKLNRSHYPPVRILSLSRGLNGIQSCVPKRWPQHRFALPRLHLCKGLPLWEQGAGSPTGEVQPAILFSPWPAPTLWGIQLW